MIGIRIKNDFKTKTELRKNKESALFNMYPCVACWNYVVKAFTLTKTIIINTIKKSNN